MKLSTQLSLKQSQSLAMTPQLVQSIKLLQLGNLELTDFIRSELEKNPLLELDPETPYFDRRINQSENGTAATAEDKTQNSAADTLEKISSELTIDAKSHEEDFDTSFENVYDSDTNVGRQDVSSAPSRDAGYQTSSLSEIDESDPISRLGERQSLTSFVEMQVACTFKQPENRRIATHIIHSLDEDGYFREEIASVVDQLNVTEAQFLNVLERFQQFEPTGIGARDLGECLKLQLQEKGQFNDAMAIMIANLGMLAKHEFPKLRKLCQVSKEEFNLMIREIRALDPRPAARYEPILAEPVVPDVFVKQKSDGNWAIELNSEALPKVLVNRDYYAELKRTVTDGEATSFLSDCLETANWLARSLDQRAQTILKVTTEIVRQQDRFFADGIEYMKPMNLKKVAEAIKMHESTVSRVTSNKYMMCERGLFELKYFFSASISGGDDTEALSAESVRHKIRQLIDAEPPRKILSDDRIVELLKETGIEIARRTVAKYRESMKIPSSVQRRREKLSKIGDC